jgi:hypothetical protein
VHALQHFHWRLIPGVTVTGFLIAPCGLGSILALKGTLAFKSRAVPVRFESGGFPKTYR